MSANVRTGITCCLMALFFLAGNAAAQTNTGEISGIVRDAQGGVLPGTTVVAEHAETRGRIARVADEQGRYLLASLRVGSYVITVELAGFRRVVRSDVIVERPQHLR